MGGMRSFLCAKQATLSASSVRSANMAACACVSACVCTLACACMSACVRVLVCACVCGSASVELVLPPATSPPNADAIAAALAIAPSRVSDLKTSTASGGGTAISFVVVPTLVSAGLNSGDILGLLAVNSDAQLDTLTVSRITGS